MAYAIGYLLPFVGVGALIVFICKGLAEESKMDSYMKEHNREMERRRAERNRKQNDMK